MAKKGIVVGIFLLSNLLLFSQIDDFSENYIDNYINENIDKDNDYVISDIDDLLINTISINNCSDDEILKSKIFNPIQKQNLIKYLNSWGEVLSYTELILIDGFENFDVEKYSTLINFAPKEQIEKYTLSKLLKNIKNENVIRVSSDANFKRNGMLGINTLLKSKLEVPEKLYVGLLYEKDQGERFLNVKNNFPEHLSSYLQYKTKYLYFLIGDYYVQFGQGVGVWRGLTFTGGVESSSNILFANKIKRKSSADECLFLRGIASEINFNNFSITSYLSYRKKDASVTFDSILNANVFSSISTTGLHRTDTEISKRDMLKEYVAGVNIEYKYNSLRFSIGGEYIAYNMYYQPKIKLENIYKNFGKDMFIIYTNSILPLKSSVLYHEFAINKIKGIAFLFGWYNYISSLVNVDLSIRYMSPKYAAYGKYINFKSPEGEYGILFKNTSYLNKNIQLNYLLNLYLPTWVSFNSYNLRARVNNTINLNFYFNKRINLIIRYTYKLNIKTKSSPKITNYINNHHHNLRFQLNLTPSDKVVLRTRVEANFNKFGRGFLMYEDIKFIFTDNLFLSFRFTTYDINSFDGRIYCYENDVLYNYSSSMYYGRGYSYFALCRYRINRNIQLWFKIYSKTSQKQFVNKNYKFTLQLIMKI
ncbi:MAG: hypothetical protein ACOX4D_06370 [Bacteroidales bacterium]|jgi:hypothetical protein